MKWKETVAAIAITVSAAAFGSIETANAKPPTLSASIADIDSVDFGIHRPRRCTLLITVREQWPSGSGIYWTTGSIIIPGAFPAPGGVYDPPGAAGPHDLDDALAVAGSDWYHSLPCVGQQGGYPSCDVVRYGPSNLPGNQYTGHGVVQCH